MLKVMIAEDEHLSREELAYFVQQERDFTLCPMAENGQHLIDLYMQHWPDVVFLDVEMPLLSGVDAARKVIEVSKEQQHAQPLFVFTTAYDAYAVQAFGLGAVDYLLKPYELRRFHETMQRVRERLQVRQSVPGSTDTAEANKRLDKLLLEDRDRMIIVPPIEILYAVRLERFLEIHTLQDIVQCKLSLTELENKLRGYSFFRSHKSYLVNLDYIHEIVPWFNGAYNIILNDSEKSKIPLSRMASKSFFTLLGQ